MQELQGEYYFEPVTDEKILKSLRRSSELNKLSKMCREKLEKIGLELEFKTEFEWKIKGGKIDAVWYIERNIFGIDTKFPLAGFEIETSDRDRKHIKGDIQNLMMLKAPMNAIILLESGFKEKKRFTSLLKFTEEFTRENAKNIIVLTEEKIDLILKKPKT